MWRRLPNNAAVLTSLAANQLKNEHSIPEMHKFLASLGITNQELNDLRIIHIAGSKGKGSTAAFVECILRRHGLRTALYTSPHLIHPRERLRFNGRSLGEFKFAQLIISLYKRLDSVPGLFRFLTLLALEEMVVRRRQGELDVAIVEVGMGGRFDATNVIEKPTITAITSLTLEHVKFLGPTLADIAFHKAGIAKARVPLFSVPQPPEAHKVIERVILELESPLYTVDASWLEQWGLEKTRLSINGQHQRHNAALAVAICQEWFKQINIDDECLDLERVKEALENTYWPGRHQIVETKDHTWFLDGAHTVESIEYAVHWFVKQVNQPRFNSSKRILVFHVSHDRSYEMLLAPIIKAIRQGVLSLGQAIFAKPYSPTNNVIEQHDLHLHKDMASYWWTQTSIPATASSSEGIIKLLGPQSSNILVTGSLYLVGDILKVLKVGVC